MTRTGHFTLVSACQRISGSSGLALPDAVFRQASNRAIATTAEPQTIVTDRPVSRTRIGRRRRPMPRHYDERPAVGVRISPAAYGYGI